MSESANVRSLEAIRTFRLAVIEFGDSATAALEMLQQEVCQAIDWLEHDRPVYWKAQVRRGFEVVAETRTNYEICRMRTVAGHRPTCIEEQKAFQRAQQRLRTAQEKIVVVKNWGKKVRHEVDEYRGRVGQLGQFLEADIPHMIAMLERMVVALEAYVATEVPSSATKPIAKPSSATTTAATTSDVSKAN